MALAASRTLFALFVTFCAPGGGWAAEKSLRSQNGKQTFVDKGPRESWEPSIHLDGRPVDRFVISSNKPTRSHRLTKGKDSRSHVLEDVDPEWVNLDGFAVLGGAPVRNSSAGQARSRHPAARNPALVQRATRVNRTAQALGVSNTRTHRRAPQSSSGPRQPERALPGAPPLERRRQHHTKPQSDQRNRNTKRLTSESVHVVSLQAQKALGRSAPADRAAATKTLPSEPPEYEARDISVRVMSPQSVLISWVDPAVEMGKVGPEEIRSYTIRYREKGESARWEYKDSTQRRMMIDTLSADGMYEFSVRITQRENHGKWSVSVFQRTPESAPSGPPENFEVKPLRGKGTAVIATWDPPEEPNGRIREYILSYAPAMKPFGMKSVTHRGSSSTATLDGLTPGERYIFKIRATNRRGQGPQSKVLSVVMPGSSSAASTFSKSKDSRSTVHAPSKQDTDHDESEVQSTKGTEERTTTQQPPRPRSAAPAIRRGRPLSQSRSYHNVFSSVRGSVRNAVTRGSSRGSSRGRAQGKEDEDEEEKNIVTTTSPVEETTTTEVAREKKEPDNDVSPEFEDEVPWTTETPSLKVLTHSPTIPHPKPPPRRPIKIRVHKKTESKAASSSSSKSFSSSSSPTSPPPTSPFDPSVSPTPPPQIQESAATRNDYVALSHPETKETYDKHSTTQTKPSSTLVKDTNSQQAEGTSVGRGSFATDRTKGTGSRYGYSRKHPGSVFRGNSTRLLNGYKPAVTSQFNSPSGTSNRGSSNRGTSNRGTSNRGSSNARSAATSRSALQDRTPPERDTTHGEGGDDSNYKGTGAEVTKKQEPTSSPSQTTEEERGEEVAKEERSSDKPVVSRTGISPSFAARYPWLARRYPGRFGSTKSSAKAPVTGTLSSAAAGRSVLRGTPGGASGATGAAGVSTIQDTSDDLRAPDSLKNGVGGALVKPSLTDKNTASSDARNPTISSSSSSPSSSETSSNSDSRHSSGRQTASNEPVPQETSNSNKNNDQNKNYLDGEKGGKYDKVALTSADPNLPVEDNDSVDTRETFSRKRPVLPSGGTHANRRPGAGGNRLPIRSKPAQNSKLGSSAYGSSSSSSDSSSSNLPQVVLTSDRDVGSDTTVSKTGGLIGGNSQSTSSSSASSSSSRGQGGRPRYPMVRGKPTNGGQLKPANGNGKNGRPNLTATSDKDSSSARETSKAVGQRFITGPDGTKWIVDLEQGLLMNQDGRVLQDSQGRPKRVVLGADGRTIFDNMGSPLLNQEGMALFGHGRDSRPVVNPKDKVLMLGGRPVVGLDRPRLSTTTTAPTTTTTAPTTTYEPTTTGMEESTAAPPFPTCPPGTFSKTDEYGYPLLDTEGILDCYPEEESSGMEMDVMVTGTMVPDALDLKKDELLVQTTMQPTTTTTEIPTSEPDTRTSNHGPSSELDLGGKKRFTAPYVNYIQKDPASPCSLTEALEYLQVDVLENLIEKDSLAANQNQPPKHKPHNLTVVAMEGCHSFIILDWGRPLRDDMVSGYMVHSASYDDVLNNRWSSKPSSGSHLPLENLKPNSRYYFKVQAKNVFGLGPVSDTLTYVTESDDPLLIERPPGGEPIWIPFTFKYNSAHSSCKGSQYVKRTWYRKFVGVVLCNSLRYKIFMGDGLREPFYSIGDTFGQGEDQCQFVDSYRDGRTGPEYLSNNLPSAQGYFRAYRQQPVSFGVIGRRTPHPFVGWYECGVPIPGKW